MSVKTTSVSSIWRLSPFEITLFVLSMACFAGAAWTVGLL
jgi:hypothetical protein